MSPSNPKQKKRGIFSRIFVYCINKLWLLTASFIILSAVLHILLGFALPEIDRYRADIITWVEQEYDINIDVEKVSAHWTSQGPVFSLASFKIKSKDDQYNIVEVGSFSIYFDMLSSIFDGRLSTEKIIIDNADLKFYLDDKLGVKLNNKNNETVSLDIEKTSQKVVDLLFAQRNVSIKNSTLKLYTQKETEFEYQVDEIKVEKFGDIHQLSGKLTYGDEGEIALVTELHGDPSIAESFSDIYISGSNINLADIPWLDSYPISKPRSGKLSWQLWGTWHEKHWQNIETSFSLKNASWSKLSQKKLAEQEDIEQKDLDGSTEEKKSSDEQVNNEQVKNELNAMLSWQQYQRDRGYLSFHHLSATTSSTDAPLLSDVFVKYTREKKDVLSWNLTTQDFSVGSLANYIGDVSNESLEYADFLKNSKFAVTFDRLNTLIVKHKGSWNLSNIDFEFSKLNYEHWSNIPRANGLSGVVKMTPQGGQATLNGNDIELEFGELFRQAIKAKKLTSNFDWNFSEKNQLRLNVNYFDFSNSDLNIKAKAAYLTQDEQPILSLYAELTDVNATNKSLYLPSGIMTKELVSYLDNGVKSGRLPIVKSIVRGPLSQFPFDNPNGIFVAYGELENAVYEYLPDWPSVKKLRAKLLFEGNGMNITANKGVSENNSVLSARAYTRDFSAKKPILELSFDVASRDNSGRDFVSQSPISFISEPLKHIDYKGELKTHIDLDVPLSGGGGIKLNGGVTLDPKTSKIHTSVIDISQASGTIKFTEKGLSRSKVEVFYLDKKLEIELRGKEKKTSPSVSLDVKGVLPAKGISNFIGERWLQYFNGEAEFSSVIQFSPVDKPEITRVLFQSDFKGMTFDFPDKFEKKPEQKEELFLTLEIGNRNQGEIKWRGIEGKWYWDKKPNNIQQQNSYGGDFFINSPSQYSKKLAPKLRVSGNVKEVDFRSWLLFIDRLTAHKDTSLKSKPSQELVFESINVSIGELKTSVVTLNNSQLHIDKLINQPWNLSLTGKQGNIGIALNADSPWEVSLTDLNITLNEDLFEKNKDKLEGVNKDQAELAVAKVNDDSDPTKLAPEDIVDMDINCKSCVIQGVDYGDILMSLRAKNNAVEFATKVVKNKQHELSLFGNWESDEQKNNKTYVEYKLATTNAGKLLKNWDLNVGVEDSSGVISAKMWWESSPWDIDYKQIEGDAHLSLGKGYLSEISDQDGRLFSLFNLQSLVRKLTFDFKDVYKKGFFYDSITGTFQLHDGILSTENVDIKGNVADVKLYGETNIKNEKIEQLAVITPHLTSSLPVLAAWAIEPTTGLIVFLLDKIMEPAVEVATRIDYRIHGNYDEVKVDKIKTSKKKIKVEYNSEDIPNSDKQPENDSQKNEDPKTKAENKDDTLPSPTAIPVSQNNK